VYTDGNEINVLSRTVIGCAFTVLNALDPGFLEKIYENALTHEMRKRGLMVEQQRAVSVHYDGIIVGDYFTDIIVENRLIVELKVVQSIHDSHRAQCIIYLKATGLKLALLLNFSRLKLEIERVANKL
jgi:GxxExxY protein